MKQDPFVHIKEKKKTCKTYTFRIKFENVQMTYLPLGPDKIGRLVYKEC